MKKQHPKLRSTVIVGCQRSGTTLVGQILGAQKKCYLIDEFEGLYPWYNSWINAEDKASELLSDVIIKAAKKYKDNRKKYNIQSDILDHTIIAKAPNLTYSFIQLSQHVPSPSIVFMVRDARAVVSSMLELKHIDMAGNQLKLINQFDELKVKYEEELFSLNDEALALHIRLAYLWKIKTSMYFSFVKNNAIPYLLKYEDLVSDPFMYTTELLQHIQLKKQEQFKQYNTVMKGSGPGNTSREVPINKSSLDKWKIKLTPKQVDDILTITGNLMKELSYVI